MTSFFVVYPGDAKARFDRTYYVEQHVPLVERLWSPLGMQSISALFPSDENRGTICVCICTFSDKASIHAALNDPQSHSIMDDIRNFTESEPFQLIGESLS